MKFKFEEKKSEEIVNGIFISGLFYFGTVILMFLVPVSIEASIIFHYIAILVVIIKYVACIFILKYLCDALYKLFKIIENK